MDTLGQLRTQVHIVNDCRLPIFVYDPFVQHADYSTLVVTHGDTVNAAGQRFLGESAVVYDTQECCWVVFDQASALVESARCQILQLS
jgi:hypothetical protein